MNKSKLLTIFAIVFASIFSFSPVIFADNVNIHPINRGGGGGGGSILVESLSGTIDGVNNVFTVPHIPLYIVINQGVYFPNHGYTRSNCTITIDTTITPPVGSVMKSISTGASCGATPPSSTTHILAEDGESLLTEGGDNLIIE